MNILSIIPARGGSKGIPQKNIHLINKKPMIAYTIEASLASKYITDTVVSSDSDKILDIASQCGAKILKRPYSLAQDYSKTNDVITHAISTIENFVHRYKYIILLQPTSPLRKTKHIDNAIEEIVSKKALSLISVKAVDSTILKSFFISEQNFLKPISNINYPFMPRQALPKVYMPNGAIYIVNSNKFNNNKKLYYPSATIPFIMDEYSSLDVDSIEDIALCEALMSKIN